MKKLILLALGLATACNSSQKTVAEPAATEPAVPMAVTYAGTITESELKEHLYTYASDEFEGRETGKEGQKKAVEYLKKAYEALGIPAAQKDGNYFQNVPLEMAKLPSGSILVGDKTFVIGEDFLTFSKSEGTYDEIQYVGYGIEDGSYSDYKDLDVSGKLVLMKFGEPMNEDGTYLLSGTEEKSVWSNVSESIGKRSRLAKEKGAKGILYYDTANYKRFKGYYDYMKQNKKGSMGLKNNKKNPAVVVLGEGMAKALLPGIDEQQAASSIGSKITFELSSDNEEIKSENVVAVLKGSEKPDEYVIISSHLDHIGVNANGDINNGADDDGSGTVAMLEIAEAFKQAADAGQGPKRSIVFLHVTGEEKGLLGSQYYADEDPIFPLEQTVANLNIDMIGRIDPKREGERNYIYLIGSDKLSTDLHELSEEVNKKYSNLELDYTYNDENDPNRFYYRSDHYNFAKNNIPIIFYFNGTHDDYHRPGDTPDKINYDLLQNRSRLIFHTAWEVANRDQRVVVDKAAK
ncbi:M28 family peptidase [Poritiphilus flavus]|uniref:M28 family peptidase n=1 Tax=Poritiphilus flavus TaxID=2697053 RepID=A0A6L9EE95_9FLAO|nr:M28 family peptidase [Poritiphilus flavus]NAS12983.1 M28 family peptidase [Poritiphilus flavus]